MMTVIRTDPATTATRNDMVLKSIAIERYSLMVYFSWALLTFISSGSNESR